MGELRSADLHLCKLGYQGTPWDIPCCLFFFKTSNFFIITSSIFGVHSYTKSRTCPSVRQTPPACFRGPGVSLLKQTNKQIMTIEYPGLLSSVFLELHCREAIKLRKWRSWAEACWRRISMNRNWQTAEKKMEGVLIRIVCRVPWLTDA